MSVGKWIWIALVIVVGLASQAQAASTEGAGLNDRVDQLEKEIAALKDGTSVDTGKKGLWGFDIPES